MLLFSVYGSRLFLAHFSLGFHEAQAFQLLLLLFFSIFQILKRIEKVG